ncbi:GFA family protein [Plastorhodobacter daqingensis]|uniref:GFA family protein n=1 Tax=Plastorhodobacter daqingensis TaxID=1387281 RepID=A0ABW2UNC5_9RHOB
MHTLSEVPLPQPGGCQCGNIRYQLRGIPLAFFICHCRECQKQSGSAFGQSLRVHCHDLQISGRTAEWSRDTASGAVTEARFCPSCGTRILHMRRGATLCHLRAGTLDDTSWLVPAAHIWARARQPWLHPDPGAMVFDEQPDSMDAICALWQARMMPTFTWAEAEGPGPAAPAGQPRSRGDG